MMDTFIVIGLGRFGRSAAEALYDMGQEVVILDVDEETVRQQADRATHAAIGDAQDIAVLRAAGAGDCDCAIVAIGEDLAASILITMNLKDLGVPRIICKARDETYKRALERVGASRVLIPEKEMAVRLVQGLGTGTSLNYLRISEEYAVVEMAVPKSWRGKTLGSIQPRERYRVTVLAVRNGQTGGVRLTPGTDVSIQPEDTVMLMGRNEDLALLQRN